MINKHLERELRENTTDHEVFSEQNYEDIETAKKLLNQQVHTNDILVDFDSILLRKLPISYFSRNLSMCDQKIKWEHFVAVEIMKRIKEKYKIETDHDLEAEEKYVYTSNEEDYLSVREILINRDDIIESLKDLKLPNLRIHFFIQSNHIQELIDEISTYLIEELPFSIMIYSTDFLLIEANSYIEYCRYYKGERIGNKKSKKKSKKI